VALRFVRVCPTHRLILEEQRHGLRGPVSLHQVKAWLVLDLTKQLILGAGRAAGGRGHAGAVFLGPRLRLDAELLVDRGDHNYGVRVPAHPAAA
jgi:hypothetical protein